jgi:hypothetical protein
MDNLSKAGRALGQKGGSIKSPAKQKASRDNGKLGGRPLYVSGFQSVWPNGHIRVAHKDYPCDYNHGTEKGKCPETIHKGEPYFEADSNPSSAGGYGHYRYCKQCAGIKRIVKGPLAK